MDCSLNLYYWLCYRGNNRIFYRRWHEQIIKEIQDKQVQEEKNNIQNRDIAEEKRIFSIDNTCNSAFADELIRHSSRNCKIQEIEVCSRPNNRQDFQDLCLHYNSSFRN